ncbi:response regulator [Maribacter sp. 2307UL18-2]|uniref:response regulator n=1 Tax=Maribacter sp. 2307UL18-2 TaxID=3386274 RepID=UPI0039BC93DC
MKTNKHLVILADDDPDDRELFRDAVAEIDAEVRIMILEDGMGLMDYLTAENAKLPDILFLDINMPLKDGFDCLREIRASERLKELCVIMFSTSYGRYDVDKSYDLGADGYIQKPFTQVEMLNVLQRTLETDWKDPCAALDRHSFVIQA